MKRNTSPEFVGIKQIKIKQKWQYWPVRLYKAANSLLWFRFDNHFNSLKEYALHLMQRGERLIYSSTDLNRLFTREVGPMELVESN